VLLVAALALALPLLTHGPLPQGSDVYAVSHYLQGFMKAFSEGDLYPRWTDRTNQALGAPSFVLFPPLVFYGAGAAAWLTGSLVSGFKLYLLLVVAATALAFYALAREWIGPGIPAALAAGLYLLLPYHVLDMYQRFAIPESTSFVFFPLLLLFARRTMTRTRARDPIFLALGYAGLVYTHLVSAYLFSLFLGVWLILEARTDWRRLLPPVAALACGLTLAAPALLPAALEKSDANISWVRETPNGDFRINFIFRDDPLPGLGFRDPVKPPVLKSAHSQLVLAGLAALMAWLWTPSADRRRRADIAALAAASGGAYLLQLGVSTPVWRLVPELATVQFPWRFQTIMVLCSALLAGMAAAAGWGSGSARHGRQARLAAGGLLALVVLLNLALGAQNAYLKPFAYDERVSREPGVVHWSDPATTPAGFEAYRRFKQMKVEMPAVSFVEGEGTARVLDWASSSRLIEVDSASGGVIELRAFWFPGWTAAVDGRPVASGPAPRSSLIRVDVPAGPHQVALRFRDTPVRAAAGWIGVTGLLLTGVAGWILGRRPAAAA